MKRWLAYELSRNDHTRVGFWPLLTNDRDYSGRGNHATPVGGSGPIREPGKNGYRLGQLGHDSAAGNEYLLLGNCTDLAFDNNFPWSVSIWFFSEYQTGQHTLMSFMGTTNNNSWAGWRLWFDDAQRQVGITCTTNWNNSEYVAAYGQFGNTLLNNNQSFGWYHVVVTYDARAGDGFRIYLNGRRLNAVYGPSTIDGSWIPPTLSNAQGYIGYGPTPAFSPQGPSWKYDTPHVGAVRLAQAWKRELGAQEVARRYRIESAVDTFGRTEAEKEFVLYLFIKGHQPLDSTGNNPYLFLEGGGPSAGIPLFLNSAQPVDTEPGMPLFVEGVGAIPSSMPLFIESTVPVSGSIPLFLLNSTTAETSTVNLFMDATPAGTPSLTAPLSILGSSGDSAFASYTPLFLEVGQHSSELTDQMNLYTAGFDRGPFASNMNLFMLGGTTEVNETMPLYLWNSQSGNIAAMYLTCWAGPTGDPGSYAFTGNFNLFIDRPTDAYTPMFIWGDTPAAPSSIPLYLHGLDFYPPPDNEVVQGMFSNMLVTQGYGLPVGMNLVLPNIQASSVYNFPFFVHGY